MPSRLAIKSEIDTVLAVNLVKYPDDFQIARIADSDKFFSRTTISAVDDVKQSLFSFSINRFYHKFSYGTSILPYTTKEMIDVITLLKARADQLWGRKKIAGVHTGRCAFFKDHEVSGSIHAQILADAVNAVDGPGSALFYPDGKPMIMDILDDSDKIIGNCDLGLVYAHTVLMPNRVD